jgi:exopolysaccharide biosynthesis operon protein EpsL
MCRWRKQLGRVARSAGATLVAGSLLVSAPAHALYGDRIELFAGQGFTYDSNVFRLSKDEDPAVIVGAPQRSDIYYTTLLGFNLNIPVSRQRFEAGWSWDFTRYQDFRALDFDGNTGRAIWHWQLGSTLDGELGYRQVHALANLANTSAGILFGTPNALDTREAFLKAGLALSARYRLEWDLNRLDQDNSLASRQVDDVVLDRIGLNALYITPAANRLGVNLEFSEGDYPNATFVDNAFQQQILAGVAEIAMSGRSRMRARAGWLNREYDQVPERNFDTGIYDLQYDWDATGKLTLNFALQRLVNPLDDSYATFVLENRVAVRPRMRFTEKIRGEAVVYAADREYVGDRIVAVGLAPARNDRIRGIGINGSYALIRQVLLEGVLRREERTSNLPLADYEYNLIGASVRFTF